MHNIIRHLAALLVALLVALLAPGAQALPLLTLTPVQTTLSASAGESLSISGSIVNRSNGSLSATDLFLDFSGFDAGALTPWQLLGQVPFVIGSYAFRDNVALFTIDIAADAPPGVQTLDVVLQDVSGNLSDVVSLTVLVDQVAAVPAPATLPLLLAALPLLRRHFTRPGDHHGHRPR